MGSEFCTLGNDIDHRIFKYDTAETLCSVASETILNQLGLIAQSTSFQRVHPISFTPTMSNIQNVDKDKMDTLCTLQNVQIGNV